MSALLSYSNKKIGIEPKPTSGLGNRFEVFEIREVVKFYAEWKKFSKRGYGGIITDPYDILSVETKRIIYYACHVSEVSEEKAKEKVKSQKSKSGFVILNESRFNRRYCFRKVP